MRIRRTGAESIRQLAWQHVTKEHTEPQSAYQSTEVKILHVHFMMGFCISNCRRSIQSAGGLRGLLALGACLFAFHSAGAQEVSESASTPSDVTSSDAAEGPGMTLLTKLPVHLSLSVSGGYDDNVNLASSSGQGSWFTNGGATLSYNLSDQATSVTLNSGAHIIYYPDQISGAQKNDLNTYLNLLATHSISLRLKLNTSLFAAYQTEPTFSSNVGIENRRANYFNTLDSFSITYNWLPRLLTTTGEMFQRIQYDSSSLGMQFDRIDNTISQQLRFELLAQRTVLVGEYRFEIVDYDSFPLDSTTHYALGGFDQTFSPQLSATVRGGLSFRSYDQNGRRTDPHFESTLIYSGAHRSFVSWNTSYGIEEPNSAQVLTRTTFRTGLQLTYGLASRIDALVSGFYHHDQNEGLNGAAGFSETAYDVSCGLRYAIRGYLTFDVSVEHSEINSGQSTHEYSRNRYSAGLTFTY